MWRVDARLSVRPKDHAHLLEHVAIIVDAGFVDTDGNRDTGRSEAVQRRNTTLETEIGAAVVAQHRARMRTQTDVVLTHPDSVSDRQSRPGKAERMNVRHRRTTGAPTGIHFLVRCLEQVRATSSRWPSRRTQSWH